VKNKLDEIFAESRSARHFAAAYADHLSNVIKSLDFGAVAEFAELVLEARRHGHRVFFMGNGGSAATASHFANDFAIGTRSPEKPFRAISLTDNVAAMTAIANDDGYDLLFVKQLEVLMGPGDVVVVISASGNSPNVVKALEYAIACGNHTVALTGFETGGKIAKLAKTVIHVKTRPGEYGPVEDVHMFIDHLIGSYLNRVVLSEKTPAAVAQAS
jgi:D-sedoheptulose 7-phosphate isomerase